MLIPNAENAVVDVRKLRDYCLNSEHDDGKHKARLFLSILGMTAGNAEELRQILLEIVTIHEARLGRQDEFGQRYTLDFTIAWQNRSATLRSGWIIEHGSKIPRLTTCYLL
ncbi:DUF6883 domain-containing protein [Myxacorys almedinensis]|uniref:DUF6883 domain-containing protein n=1 Tax=Myxacorys almedinensis A TaxID=2690445 RepID=A0A8J7ZCG3_9CYAN|nr:DUF6883 domain-containing protein [Myxacorys almedinensis]NDJ19410.1 hypothetical protein [Myxacorys almedinensis A]